jgi:hypothetical protein
MMAEQLHCKIVRANLVENDCLAVLFVKPDNTFSYARIHVGGAVPDYLKVFRLIDDEQDNFGCQKPETIVIQKLGTDDDVQPGKPFIVENPHDQYQVLEVCLRSASIH